MSLQKAKEEEFLELEQGKICFAIYFEVYEALPLC